MPRAPEPSHEEVIKLREATLEHLQNDGTIDTLDPIDVNRFKTEDAYVKRFLIHQHNDQSKGKTMAVDALKWRKEIGANNITIDTIDRSCIDDSILFVHNRDTDGCKMLQFTVRKHTKSAEQQEKMRKTMIYWVERLEREEKGKFITVVFDMQETGIRHMDMDFIQYTINLFKFYYPDILNYIIVIEMPWLLNAMWKIIKSWLPPDALEKIKFVDKKQLLTYVPVDQCFLRWGGTDQSAFEFIPEETANTSEPIAVTPVVEVIEDIDPKKVHFNDSSASSASSIKANGMVVQTESGSLSVEVNPSEELVFPTNRVGAVAQITIRNCGSSCIAFKIKTTALDKYRVRPHVGTIVENEKAVVLVTLCDAITPAVLVRDKFLVMAMATKDATIIPDSQMFKDVAQEDLFETKIRLGIETPETPTAVVTAANSLNSSQTMVVPPALTDKLNEIVLKQADLQQEVNSSRRLMLITLLTMLAILVYVIISTNNTTSMLLQKESGTHYKPGEL